MTTGARIHLIAGLALACAVLPAAARQPAMLDANGGSASCPATAETDADAEPVRATDKRVVAPGKTRPAVVRRGGESEAAARPPRWHSFLPGMIR